ncbi:MAG: ABC transporter permease [Mycetocola sp.]
MTTQTTTSGSPVPRTQRRALRGGPKRTEASLRWWLFVPAGLLVLLAAVGPFLVPFNPVDIVGVPSQPPGAEHWFGTDQNGMDVFSRVVAAARTNLLVAAIAAIGSTVLGIVIGVIGGMNEAARGLRGFLARSLARAVEILDAVPAIIIGLVLVSLFGPSVATIIGVLVIVSLARQSKLVRTEVLKVRGDSFVDAARMAGAREINVMFTTVLPNSIRPSFENFSATFGLAIIVEAALGFLGVGLPPPTPEWGTMIATGAADALNYRWWGAAFPTIALIVTVSSIALAGSELLRKRH